MATASMSGRSAWRLWAVLAALWLVSLPLRPLIDPDEGRYAEIPREMLASGDWTTPTLSDLKYFEKPPLQYWATAAVYAAVGPSEWSSRLWASILAFACIPLVFGFSRRLGHSHDRSVVAGMLLAINPYFAIIGQINLLDQAFAFFLTAALFAFVVAQREPAPLPQRKWMWLAWASLALAVLSKGIVAPVLLGGTLVVYALVCRSVRFLKTMHWTSGLLIFSVLTLPWFWLVQKRNPEFAQFFFVHEHFARFLTTVHEHAQPWWYFPALLLFAALPFIRSAPAALALAWRHEPEQAFQSSRLLLIWCTVVLVFFSVSHSKLAPYILPIMPSLALLLSRALIDDRKALGRATLATLGLITLASAGIAIRILRSGNDASVVAWSLAGIAIVLIALILLRFVRHTEPVAWSVLAGANILGMQVLLMAYTQLPPDRNAKLLAQHVATAIRPDTQLFFVDQYRQSLEFYLQRTTRVFVYRGELEFGMQQLDGNERRDLASFQQQWQAADNAIAFLSDAEYGRLKDQNLPGRILAHDSRSLALSRR
jgi:4-amino-4-deoxy-L-arabinose transferase-like glycosyltransferase